MGRPELAARSVAVAEKRLSTDKWPHDTTQGRFIGKQARLHQTWSIAGFLVAKQLLRNQEAANILINEEDAELINIFYYMVNAKSRRKRGKRIEELYNIIKAMREK